MEQNDTKKFKVGMVLLQWKKVCLQLELADVRKLFVSSKLQYV